MAGILDSKSRILDTILTLEGKKQLSNGGIGIKYVTFTDNATYYAADLENGASSATNRIYFEVLNCHMIKLHFYLMIMVNCQVIQKML